MARRIKSKPGEIWVKVKRNPNYYVSNYGRLWNIRSKKLRKPVYNKCGTWRVNLSSTKKKVPGITVSMAHLVAEAFLPPPTVPSYVGHLDGNQKNDCVSNLVWISNTNKRWQCRNHTKGNSTYSGTRVICQIDPKTGSVIAEYKNCRVASDILGFSVFGIRSSLRLSRKQKTPILFNGYLWVHKIT